MAVVREDNDYLKKFALLHFFSCLANALSYIHNIRSPIKHMDIKPKNILVRAQHLNHRLLPYEIYIADFGISRSYESLEEAETHGVLTAFTRAYAAPEVALDNPRGLSADVFSMGCVFVEMLATLSGTGSSCWDNLQSLREMNEDGDTSYFQNLQTILNFSECLGNTPRPKTPITKAFAKDIICIEIDVNRMLQFDRRSRPRAAEIAHSFKKLQLGCLHCDDGRERFVAFDDSVAST
jgi:serine/threonine protein kinase